jgi:hypothetical protein
MEKPDDRKINTHTTDNGRFSSISFASSSPNSSSRCHDVHGDDMSPKYSLPHQAIMSAGGWLQIFFLFLVSSF